MAEKIRIPDLRAPVLNATQRRALADAEHAVLDLTVDGVLTAAADQTGLDDFGRDDFIERLALLLEAVAWPGHTKLAQNSSFRRLVNKAIDRLLTVDLLRRHPEIHDETIEAPLIIAGLPRSGTTHLLNLIAADSRFQSTPYWQVLRPIPLLPMDEVGPCGSDPRWQRAYAAWQQLPLMNPYAEAFHPHHPDHISEDGELQMADFSSYVWEFSLRAPQWRDYYFAHDQTPHYAYEKVMLQILQWQRGERKRWIVKAPQHLEQLRPIMNVFPDARVVFTHRDPVASLQSILTMRTYAARTREHQLDIGYDLSYWTERYGRLLDSFMSDVDLIPPRHRFDCLFREFMEDDIAMIERLYQALGLEMTAKARRELERYMATNQRGANGQIGFDLRRDFEAEPATIRERYRQYTDSIPVGIEVA